MGKKRNRRRSHSKNWFQRNWAYGLLALFAVASLSIAAYALAPQPTGPTRASTWTPEPEAPDTRQQVLFIGDSYTAGSGASSQGARWSTLASQQLGFIEGNQARGGTGYIATSGVQGCGEDYCPNYVEAITTSTEFTPNVVVISGGRNDGRPAAGYTAAVRATIDATKAKWPDASVVVTSPIWDDDAAPGWMADTVTAVRDAAASTGAKFLDLGTPLAGKPDYMSPDGVHPNDAGYKAIATAFVAGWPSTGL